MKVYVHCWSDGYSGVRIEGVSTDERRALPEGPIGGNYLQEFILDADIVCGQVESMIGRLEAALVFLQRDGSDTSIVVAQLLEQVMDILRGGT